MLLDERLHLRQRDPLVHADRLGRQIGRQRQTAVWARCRAVVDDRVRLLGEDAAVAFVARLRPAWAGLLAPLCCGYEDCDDLDALRTDPAFKLACGCLPDTGIDLCS